MLFAIRDDDVAVPAIAHVQWGLIEPARITEEITKRGIAKVLKEAAAEAEKMITFNLEKGTFSGKVRAAQLRAATAGMGQLSTELWSQVGRATRGGMYQAAELAADQALDRDFFLGMPGRGVMQMADYTHFIGAQVVDDLISRHSSGFALADRIYANGKVTTKTVGRIVDRGLATGLSAKEIAKKVKGYYRPDVPGGASYAAMRLGRTEINNAHHHTSIAISKDRPWITAFKWNLSRSHPKPDPCDALATNDQDDMGPGVYAKDHAPDKPHPQCLCYLTHVTEDEDEFMDKLVRGDYDDHLSRAGVVC